MIDNEHISEIDPIGTVTMVIGQVQAHLSGGTARELQVNSQVYLGDRIITDGNGKISISFNDGSGDQLDLGGMSDILLNEDLLSGVNLEDLSDAVVDLDSIQQVFQDWDFDENTIFGDFADEPIDRFEELSEGDGNSSLASNRADGVDKQPHFENDPVTVDPDIDSLVPPGEEIS